MGGITTKRARVIDKYRCLGQWREGRGGGTKAPLAMFPFPGARSSLSTPRAHEVLLLFSSPSESRHCICNGLGGLSL